MFNQLLLLAQDAGGPVATDPSFFESWFAGVDPGDRFALTVVLVGCSTAIIIVALLAIGGTIKAMHARTVDAKLKREMLDRGLAIDEIVRVVEAAPPKDEDD